MRASFIAVVLATVLLIAAGSARAQQEDAQYRSIIAEAVAEFDAQHFAEARALFMRAHDLSPSARTLRGIGMASFEMRDYVEAYRALAASLDDTRRPLTDIQRTEITALRDRTAGFVGLYRVALDPSSASLAVDGAAATNAPDGRLLLAIGTHELVARANGYRNARTTVAVRGGEDQSLTIALERDVGASGAVTSHRSAGTSAGDLSAPDEDRASGSVLPIALVIGGGVALGAAVAVGIAGWVSRNDEIQSCEEAGSMCDNLGTLETERTIAAAATIGLAVVGAAGVAIGLVVLTSGGASSSRGTRHASLDVECGAGAFTLACRGRF